MKVDSPPPQLEDVSFYDWLRHKKVRLTSVIWWWLAVTIGGHFLDYFWDRL